MRRVWISLCVIAAGFLSCDDSFDPHGEFTERPVLYCVMQGSVYGSASQSAVLTRTVPGRAILDYSEGFSSPVIRGAEITLQVGERSYVLVETLDTINAGTAREIVQLTYRHPSVSVLPSQAASIRAALPDGRVLTAATEVPPGLAFELSYTFPHGFTTAINPLSRGTTWTFTWWAPAGQLHFPELLLIYSVLREDSTTTTSAVAIPQQFLVEEGKEWAITPQPTYEQYCGFEYAAIDTAFARLGRNEGAFLRLTVHSLQFSVITHDVHLARFYTSVHGSMDPYSIRIDEAVYSNISGGIGVFGTYAVSRSEFEVDRAYAESFGYHAD